MLPLERRPSAGFGLALLTIGHAVGWPFPRGGSQALADALAARLRALGGEIRVVVAVDELPRADVVLVRRLAARARCASRRAARTATSARCAATATAPARSSSTGRSSGPIPWRDERCAQAATVHLGGSLDEICASERAPCERRHVDAAVRAARAAVALCDDSRAPPGSTPRGRTATSRTGRRST